MYKVFVALLMIFWLCDIFNIPSMEMFDTVYQINGGLWTAIWIGVFIIDEEVRR